MAICDKVEPLNVWGPPSPVLRTNMAQHMLYGAGNMLHGAGNMLYGVLCALQLPLYATRRHGPGVQWNGLVGIWKASGYIRNGMGFNWN